MKQESSGIGGARVLFVITKLELGGAQKVCLSLFNNLRSYGISTALVSGKEGPLAQTVAHNASVYLIDSLKREITFLSLTREIHAFWKLVTYMRRLKKKHPRLVVHTHSTKAGILGRWAALFAGVKRRVHTVHGFGFHAYQNPIFWIISCTLEWITCLITTRYVCVSSHDQRVGERYLWGFRRKVTLIRAAVEDSRFLAARRAEVPQSNRFTFGTVSCFKPQKNLFDLLRAFDFVSKQAKKPVMLQLVGDGKQRAAIEAWVKQHGHCDTITLLGWQDNVAACMRSWDVFVMSSLWEGLPCSIVEARMLGLPVISYNVGGISDIVVHGKNGFLVTPRHWEKLAWYMLKVLDAEGLRNNLSRHQETFSNFREDTMAQQHVDLYRSLFLS